MAGGGASCILFLMTACFVALTAWCQVSPDLRIVLVGKTGAGKSATGNIILRMDAFREDVSADSVTQSCQTAEAEVEGRNVHIVDSPGIFDTRKTQDEVKTDVEKCVEMSVPGPHVFLLVVRIGRFTEEERNAVNWIQENFGEDSNMYSIVLFTHADQLKEKSMKQVLKENVHLRRLVNECGDRYHAFDNTKRDRTQVTKLLEKIEKMMEDNQGKHYTNEMYQEAQRKIREEKERREREEERRRQEEEERIRSWEKLSTLCQLAKYAALGTMRTGVSQILMSVGAALGLGGLHECFEN